jgi:tRNA(His) guanylyltransferase
MGNLSDRMRTYETVSKPRLIRRLPVIIRIDGNAFHTLTKKLKCDKPWDSKFDHTMDLVALQLCQTVIQNARLAYIQSDEISFLLNDYTTHQTEPWFDNKVDKLTSISASKASTWFNFYWMEKTNSQYTYYSFPPTASLCPSPEYVDTIEFKYDYPFASFDSRAFNLPKDEVVNYFIERQQDATRNSIQSLAQAHFSHKSLHKLNQSQLQEKLMTEKQINWNDCKTRNKRGRCAIKVAYHNNPNTNLNIPGPHLPKTTWIIDEDIPLFTENREYIQRLLAEEWEYPMFTKETVNNALKL